MSQFVVRHLATAVVGLCVSTVALGTDDPAAARQALQRASAAEEALSLRYTAIWVTLDRAQKTRFSAQERAWLNEGRQLERQACLQHAGQRSDLAVHTCEAEVVERRLRMLAAPLRTSASR